MANQLQVLAQQFFDKESAEDCSVEELRHAARRHPYFAPVQFLLVEKLKNSVEEMRRQKAKAVLFYPDPLLFERFINGDGFEDEERLADRNSEPIIALPQPADEVVVKDESVELTEPDNSKGENLESHEATTFIHQEIEADAFLGVNNNEGTSEHETISSTELPGPQLLSAEAASTKQDEVQSEAIKVDEPEISSPAFTFEPFHTVDYFASQGIKIATEDIAKDKLGKQLKSFTEWLRTMKRLPGNPPLAPAADHAEKKVETLASHSVSESNVVTEAMADVWAQQGNKEKALDIYNKLSLQTPSKKAYFAAKIEQLKTS